MRLPSLRALQAFEAVGRRRSITLAAKELGVSPAAVTQQIRILEAETATRLVERRGNGVDLTAWGRLYHGEVAEAFRKLEEAQETLARARTRGILVVSCLPSVATKWLSRRLLDWQADHPGAQVHLIATEIEPRLGQDAVDFRIGYGAAAAGHDAFAELFVDWVAPASSPAFLARQPVGAPADILDRPLLRIDWGLERDRPPTWEDWARAIGAAPPAAEGQLTFSLSSSAIDAAVDGRGFVLGQMAMIGDDVAAGRLAIPHDRRLRLPEPYFLAWDRAALVKPFAAELRAFVIAAGRRQEALSRPGGPADADMPSAAPAGTEADGPVSPAKTRRGSPARRAARPS